MFRALLPILLIALGLAGVDAITRQQIQARKHAALSKSFHETSSQQKLLSDSMLHESDKTRPTLEFKNPKAKEFYVQGDKIPLVDFDVGPSWAGLLPISSEPHETRKLFFWFYPPGPDGSVDDLIFWTNGGPGCSSMEGLLQENGPISWMVGTAKPILNPHSWTNLSSILFVEQPIGTGFSTGVPDAKDERDVAVQLVGFFQQFLGVFEELKGKNFYLTGESYAGTYIPYLADYIYENPGLLDLQLQGIWIADPSLSFDIIQEEIPAADFLHKFENVFALNQTALNQIDDKARQCNYTGYIEKYVTYPPKGPLPYPDGKFVSDGVIPDECDVWGDILDAALLINPAFNIYRIFDTWPILWDVLGIPGTFEEAQTLPLYFDRQDVKEAIHAPTNTSWKVCADIDVFPHGDGSLPPALTVLPNVVEKNNRTVIIHGQADYVLIAEGTRIVLQNLTWHSKQGFQNAPKLDSFIVDGMGAMGTVQLERGLTYIEVVLSGHMVPQFSPQAAFRTMEYLLGFKEYPSD
ncbi:alpha/beta-hydrolase [Sistotremastrum suecicum HHB10207 ss-3]|uniref:Carboxypeptidase n=1 Tax=Sistotremastrum suecicum HHB10207 ss-3 TaxID=1314776 RepID=A0A166ADH6_9AGAM|nr:alpha/beta-hydrolase [Sistotremastrum suecicum HHB10207 ss-3]